MIQKQKSFGFGGTPNQQPDEKRGPSVTIPLEVTLKDLYLGKELKVAHKKQVLCPKCRGSGAKRAEDVVICSKCKGTGVITVTQQLGPGFVTQTQRRFFLNKFNTISYSTMCSLNKVVTNVVVKVKLLKVLVPIVMAKKYLLEKTLLQF